MVSGSSGWGYCVGMATRTLEDAVGAHRNPERPNSIWNPGIVTHAAKTRSKISDWKLLKFIADGIAKISKRGWGIVPLRGFQTHFAIPFKSSFAGFLKLYSTPDLFHTRNFSGARKFRDSRDLWTPRNVHPGGVTITPSP